MPIYAKDWSILIYLISDSDRENLSKESLEKQYNIVKRETDTSTVCQFGDMAMSKMMVSEFQGDSKATPYHYYYYNELGDDWDPESCGRDAVPGPEVK